MSTTFTPTILGAAALIALLTTGCATTEEQAVTTAGSTSQSTSHSAGTKAARVPEACREAFPVAVGPADLADLDLRPAGLPEPPVEATLCETSSTMDDQVQIASYATTASPDEVLDAYAKALAAHDVVREDRGAGETVTAVVDGTAVEVTPRDGAFTIGFAAS